MKKVIVALAVVLAAAGCKEKKQKPADEAVPVTVATVEQKDVPIQIRAIGNVQPLSNVAVRALVGGQLQRVGFKEGDDVSRGQLLFTIDPRPFDAELRQAEANLQRDEAQLRNAEAQAKRYSDLVKKDYVTKEEYDKLVAAAEAARAVVAADRAGIENARLQRSYCEIRSPLAGRTGSLMVHAGNLVKANDTTPLVVINQVQPVNVQFAVPEQNLGLLRQREGAAVEASPQQGGAPMATGTLTFIDNNVDTTTGTIALKATFANKDRALWPGQYVNVAITTDNRANAIVVPLRAVQTGQKGQYVYVVKGGNAVEMRPVSVYKTIDQDAIIEKGVRAGETVVTDGQLRLTPKSKVEIKGS
ncbi:MAG TPA: efflux RND transporter periplasmic adaptor subunit [Thermoanaerobaculia bacterium]|nr:efflux RND transporter periplasmic adaptor subunit [Thermoanaerobaculia bacterium]